MSWHSLYELVWWLSIMGAFYRLLDCTIPEGWFD